MEHHDNTEHCAVQKTRSAGTPLSLSEAEVNFPLDLCFRITGPNLSSNSSHYSLITSFNNPLGLVGEIWIFLLLILHSAIFYRKLWTLGLPGGYRLFKFEGNVYIDTILLADETPWFHPHFISKSLLFMPNFFINLVT